MSEKPTSGADPSSYLFVPASRPDRFEKAAASGAHRIILDLEDAVSPAEKDAARGSVLEWFRAGRSAIIRINGADSPWFDADLAALAACRPTEIMVPKADPSTLQLVSRHLVDRPLVALIETVSGLVQANEIVGVGGVARLAFGNIDFSFDARMPAESPALDQARFKISIASRYAGLPSPIDGVTVALDDQSVLQADIDRARNLGFGAKLCIHPKQVDLVNAGFVPSAEEIEWARGVLAAVQKGGEGVLQLQGKMIDKPVVERARYLLEKHCQA